MHFLTFLIFCGKAIEVKTFAVASCIILVLRTGLR